MAKNVQLKSFRPTFVNELSDNNREKDVWHVDNFFICFGQSHNVERYSFLMNVQFIAVVGFETFIFRAKKIALLLRTGAQPLHVMVWATMSSKHLIRLYF